jgi:hypothetical protein
VNGTFSEMARLLSVTESYPAMEHIGNRTWI